MVVHDAMESRRMHRAKLRAAGRVWPDVEDGEIATPGPMTRGGWGAAANVGRAAVAGRPTDAGGARRPRRGPG